MDPVNIPAKFEVRSFIRSWDNRGYSKNLGSGSPCIRHAPFSPKIFNRLLFAWTLWIYLPSLKFVALPVPEIRGSTLKKIWAVPGYAQAPFSPKFLMGFDRMDPLNILAKFEVRSFTHSWDNRGYRYSKNLGRLWIRPNSPKFLKGFCSHGPSECIGQICSP